jgi:hypothetical protein
MVCLQHAPDPGTPWQQDISGTANEVPMMSTKIAARPRTRAVMVFIAISYGAILSPTYQQCKAKLAKLGHYLPIWRIAVLIVRRDNYRIKSQQRIPSDGLGAEPGRWIQLEALPQNVLTVCAACQRLERKYQLTVDEIYSVVKGRFTTVGDKLRELFRCQDLRDEAMKAIHVHKKTHARRISDFAHANPPNKRASPVPFTSEREQA